MHKSLYSLQGKVISIILVLIVISEAALALLSYYTTHAIFLHQTKVSMEGVLTFRSSSLASELRQIGDQASSLAKIELLGKSMVNLKSGWSTLSKAPGGAKAELQQYFVRGNPNPIFEREKLLKPIGPSGYYYSAHEQLQQQIGKVLAATSFKDMLMLDAEGNIIYSYRKSDIFAENATDARFVRTGVGKVFAEIMSKISVAQTDDVLGSFSGIMMSKQTGKSDIYAAVPLINLGHLRGIFVFQVRDNAISQTLSMGIPAGSSEKSHIITADGTVIGVGDAGDLIIVDPADYRYKDATLAGGAMSVTPLARVDGSATSFKTTVLQGDARYMLSESVLNSEMQVASLQVAVLLALVGGLVLAFTSAIAWFVLRYMFAPLGKLATATEAVAGGDLNICVSGHTRKDEIGTMSRALASFRDSLLGQRKLEAQANAAQVAEEDGRRSRAEEQRQQSEALQYVVSALGEGLTRMACGDLVYQIDKPFPLALDGLRHNFNASVHQLAETLTAINRNSNSIRAGTEEMRSSADQLAERTERQSASTSEVATAIDQITKTVKQQMARAEEASRTALNANAGTKASAKIMEQTISAMEAIQSSSQQINVIISVIDEIAFQTNLLALNAGVEAARAGSSGKGFAVVAQEVRELAQRSARAAKEITELLSKSTIEVDAGVSMVEKAGDALKGIANHVETISVHISAMMESTREEASTLREINAAITQIENTTQQNAAMVEETTASIHQLGREAHEMDGLIGRFQLVEGGGKQWRNAS